MSAMFEIKELSEQLRQKDDQISEAERDAAKSNSEAIIFSLQRIFLNFYFQNETLRSQNLKLEAQCQAKVREALNKAEESQKTKSEAIIFSL